MIGILTFINNSKIIGQSKYKDFSSSYEDLEFYKLKSRDSKTIDGIQISISIPDEYEGMEIYVHQDLNNNTVFFYEYFDKNRIIEIYLETLQTRNTIKFESDKQYIDLCGRLFNENMNGDLSEIEKILPPVMANCKVVDFQQNLKINDKYYAKRTCYYNDKRLEGTVYEKSTTTEFHYFTLHNKTKYELFMKYIGNDKGVGDLTAFFGTIAGSLKFE